MCAASPITFQHIPFLALLRDEGSCQFAAGPCAALTFSKLPKLAEWCLVTAGFDRPVMLLQTYGRIHHVEIDNRGQRLHGCMT